MSGDSLMKMKDGSQKRLDQAKMGDVVSTGNGTFSEIKCIVKTKS